MTDWWTTPYPKASAPAYKGELPRPLYPPDVQGYDPSTGGPDVTAYKRGISRGGRWPWTTFDDAYSNNFAHGKAGGNVGDSGVEGFQRQMGIQPSGNIGQATMEAISLAKIPQGLPNAGQPLLDGPAVQMLEDAAKMEHSDSNTDKIRKLITEFCQKAEANEDNWHYSQNRPIDISVDPSASSVNSDCSGLVIQAYNYAKRKSGLAVPDPAKQGWSGFGNTDLYEDDHPTVSNGSYLVGDLAHYKGHVCICRKAGNSSSAIWTSHGQEAGPDPVNLYYRTDFRKVVRPPLL